MPISAVNLFKPSGKAKAGSQSIPLRCTPEENLSSRAEEIQKTNCNMLERLWRG